MSNYTILAGNQRYSLHETEGRVTIISSALDWALGLPFEHVRSYCEQKGWKLVPIINELDVTTFVHDGDQYCLFHSGREIKRITKNGL